MTDSYGCTGTSIDGLSLSLSLVPITTTTTPHKQEAVKKVKVYVRPEGFPSPEEDDAGALDAVAINDDGAPYVRAEAHGLSADSIYACTFRLLFPDGSCYPRSDEDMPPLLGMPTPAPSSFEDEVRVIVHAFVGVGGSHGMAWMNACTRGFGGRRSVARETHTTHDIHHTDRLPPSGCWSSSSRTS